MTFTECMAECAANAEFVAEFNRLTGCHLGQSANRTTIEVMVDNAAGYPGESEDDMMTFCAFVMEYVWLRIPPDDEPVGTP